MGFKRLSVIKNDVNDETYGLIDEKGGLVYESTFTLRDATMLEEACNHLEDIDFGKAVEYVHSKGCEFDFELVD